MPILPGYFRISFKYPIPLFYLTFPILNTCLHNKAFRFDYNTKIFSKITKVLSRFTQVFLLKLPTIRVIALTNCFWRMLLARLNRYPHHKTKFFSDFWHHPAGKGVVDFGAPDSIKNFLKEDAGNSHHRYCA